MKTIRELSKEGRGFTWEEYNFARELFDKLYPYPEKGPAERKRAENYEELLKNLTEEEVNSALLAIAPNCDAAYEILGLRNNSIHPKLKKSTLNKAIFSILGGESYIGTSEPSSVTAVNNLFAAGAENPYCEAKGWPDCNEGDYFIRQVLDGRIRAPIPKDPKDAKAYLDALSAMTERRIKRKLEEKKRKLDKEKATPERQKYAKDLKELDETMKPTSLRQRLKRQMVADYRKDHPKSKGSR